LKPETVRKVESRPDPARLASDLEALREMAIARGAAEASVIDAARVVCDPAVKKRVEASAGYVSYHWPLAYPKDSVEEAVAAYQKGVFFRVRPGGKSGEKFPEYMGGPIADPGHRGLFLKVYEITAALESASFYYGYHLAMGFAAGNCRAVFCADEPGCQAMKKGRPCLHPYKARPSMEAVGMDGRRLARDLGWQAAPGDDEGFLAALVLVF
jgi:predicted metal-binding protein